MRMAKYSAKRVVLMFFTLFVISTICFVLIRILPRELPHRLGIHDMLAETSSGQFHMIFAIDDRVIAGTEEDTTIHPDSGELIAGHVHLLPLLPCLTTEYNFTRRCFIHGVPPLPWA